jgi:hypothetical protein
VDLLFCFTVFGMQWWICCFVLLFLVCSGGFVVLFYCFWYAVVDLLFRFTVSGMSDLKWWICCFILLFMVCTEIQSNAEVVDLLISFTVSGMP